MFDTRVIVGTYLNIVYQLMLHTKYQGSRSGGFRQEVFFMFSLYVTQCKKESMTRKCPTHTLHTNPWHREEESKNNNSLINSVTSRTMSFWPQNHNLNKLGRCYISNIKPFNIWQACVLICSLYKLYLYPRGGIIFGHRAIFSNKFRKSTRWCYMPNINCRFCGFRLDYFNCSIYKPM